MKTITLYAKPSIVIVYLLCLGLAAALCFLSLNTAWGWDNKLSVHNVFAALFFATPFIFGLAIILAAILLKKVTFATEEIVITYPLVFYTRTINIKDVSKIRAKPYFIRSYRNGKITTYYRGEELIFYRKTKRILKLNSMEYRRFADLKSALANKITTDK